jgi:hypothetical protein
MGTKNNPGNFNCHAAAMPDEPIFVLLGRDPAAPHAIECWVEERERLGKVETDDDRDRIAECRAAQAKMRIWREANLFGPNGQPTWKESREHSLEEAMRPIKFDPAGVEASGDGDEAVRINRTWLLELARALRDAGDLNKPREIASLLELAARALSPRKPSPEKEDRMDPRPEAAYDAADDLASAPRIPDHRFGSMVKTEHYAYARGLNVNPSFLPEALEAMQADGWHLLAIFGQTDSANIGFIFEQKTLPPCAEEPGARTHLGKRNRSMIANLEQRGILNEREANEMRMRIAAQENNVVDAPRELPID